MFSRVTAILAIVNHGELLTQIEKDYRGRGEFNIRDIQSRYRIGQKVAEFVIKSLIHKGKLYYNLEFELPIFCFLPADDDQAHRVIDLPLYPGMDLFSDGETCNEVYKEDLPSSAFRISIKVNNYKEIIQKEAI